MGRKPIANPKIAKTISLPSNLWDKLDKSTKNRSFYIQRTLEARLDDTIEQSMFDIRDMGARQIGAILQSKLGKLTLEDDEDVKKLYFDLGRLIKERKI